MEKRNFEWLSDTNISEGDSVILRDGSNHTVTRVFDLRKHTGLDDIDHYHLIELDNGKHTFTYDDEGNFFSQEASSFDIMQVNLKEDEPEVLFHPHTGSY